MALAYATLCLLPSTTWIAIKIGLGGTGPLLGAGLRFLVAGACLLAACGAMRMDVRLPPRTLRHVVLFGALMFAVPYAGIYIAETRITSGLAAVLFGTMPLFAVVAADRGSPREPLTGPKLAGVAVGLAGVVVVFWATLHLSASVLTMLAMLGVVVGALTSALAQVRGRTLPAGVRIPVLVAWASVLAGVALVALALTLGEHSVRLNARTVGSVLYLGVTAAAGFLSMFWLLQRIGAVFVSLHALVVPLLALLWGALFYGEPLTLSLGIGTLVVVAGLVFVTGDAVRRAQIDGRARDEVT